jgi:hypothetical protein
MPNRFISIARPVSIAIAMAAAIVQPTAAQSEPTALQKLLGNLGLLEIPNDNPPVYRERAPLVVPPSSELVAPRRAEDVSKYNPDWPLDHTARAAQRDVEGERLADEDFYSGRALLPSELRGKGRRADQPRAKGEVGTLEKSQQPLSPTQLGFRGWGAKQEEKVVFTGEPERRSLTDPPPGLQTPSRDAPYGVVSTKPAPIKPSTLYERVGDVDTMRK